MTTTHLVCSRLSVVLFAILLITACSETGESSSEKETEAEIEQNPLNPFEKLLGKWADTSGKNEFYELWENDGESLKGTGLVLSEGDTVFIEHLEILRKQDEWYYSARIDGQNRGEAIMFRNTVARDSIFIFENPDHDFPQSISYELLSSGGIQIFTKGVEDGKVRTEEFNMRAVAESGKSNS